MAKPYALPRYSKYKHNIPVFTICMTEVIMKHIIIEQILIPAIARLYQIDYDNIRLGVSERNICARLAHHIENIMREYDQQHDHSLFIGYYADVEYNRMGNGDLKQYENSEHRPQYMISDLLIQSRGYERNLLAVEMKRKGNHKHEIEDRERLKSLVSLDRGIMAARCVHNTLLGVFMVYSPKDIRIEFYENINGFGELTQELEFIRKRYNSGYEIVVRTRKECRQSD